MVAGEFLIERLSRALNRLGETVIVDWLQKVIQRVSIEGLQCELVVGCNENHGRHIAPGQATKYVEAIHSRHLDVEEHQIRRVLLHCRQRFASVATHSTDAYVRIFFEPDFESASGQLFVIYDQRFKHSQSRKAC